MSETTPAMALGKASAEICCLWLLWSVPVSPFQPLSLHKPQAWSCSCCCWVKVAEVFFCKASSSHLSECGPCAAVLGVFWEKQCLSKAVVCCGWGTVLTGVGMLELSWFFVEWWCFVVGIFCWFFVWLVGFVFLFRDKWMCFFLCYLMVCWTNASPVQGGGLELLFGPSLFLALFTKFYVGVWRLVLGQLWC